MVKLAAGGAQMDNFCAEIGFPASIRMCIRARMFANRREINEIRCSTGPHKP